jgi:hypothetical protein
LNFARIFGKKLAGDEILATFADNKDMNAYKFNTTVQKGGMIFFPFHNGLLSPEVEVTVVPQYNFPINISALQAVRFASLGRKGNQNKEGAFRTECVQR